MNILMLGRAVGVSSLILSLAGGCGGGGSSAVVDPSAVPVHVDGAVLARQNCARCHDPGDGSYSGQTTTVAADGMVFPKNLTPDEATGVGGWSDDQLAAAIRTGLDDQGQALCSTMPRFNAFSDGDVAQIVTFLRSLPPIAKEIPDSSCGRP